MKEEYLPLVIREFRRIRSQAEAALAQLPTEAFFAVPSPGDNSVAVIVKHIAGNMISRWTDFLTSDGEKPDRDRDDEFQLTEKDTREHLQTRWEQGWAALLNALTPLSAADLDRDVQIRGESLTVLQAINRQLTHYAYHLGQIVYLAKHFAGPKWKSLSIPLGQSRTFNQAPATYIEPAPPDATGTPPRTPSGA